MPSERSAHAPGRGRLASPVRIVLGLLSAIAIALVATTIIARVAVAAGADPGFEPFTFKAYGVFTIAGVLAGFVGWLTIRALTSRAAVALAILVPAVLLASFIPDLGFLGAWGEPSTIGGIALMAMHLVIVAVAVPTYQVIAPVRFARE